MLRKIFIAFVLLLVIALSIASYKVQSPRFWEATLEAYMKGRYPGISISHVKIGRVEWSKDLSVAFDDVEMFLSVDNRQVFGRMNGYLKGNVRVKWPGRVDVLSAQFDAPKGGEIKAELLSYLAQYIPQREDLEDLIRYNKTLVLDNAFIELILLSTDKATSHIKMYASKLNLDINLRVDVNIDGGIEALWKRFML